MTTPLIDKDWDPEDLFSSHYDTLGWAATWMACAGSTTTALADGTDYLDDEVDEHEDCAFCEAGIAEEHYPEPADPRADVEAYWYAINDGWVTA
jgi:hypothetical protein